MKNSEIYGVNMVFIEFRIKSYRKESKWTSKATDITQTVRRYYSNALTDAEKQNTLDKFFLKIKFRDRKRNKYRSKDKEGES
jgi:hypothetical protein